MIYLIDNHGFELSFLRMRKGIRKLYMYIELKSYKFNFLKKLIIQYERLVVRIHD